MRSCSPLGRSRTSYRQSASKVPITSTLCWWQCSGRSASVRRCPIEGCRKDGKPIIAGLSRRIDERKEAQLSAGQARLRAELATQDRAAQTDRGALEEGTECMTCRKESVATSALCSGQLHDHPVEHCPCVCAGSRPIAEYLYLACGRIPAAASRLSCSGAGPTGRTSLTRRVLSVMFGLMVRYARDSFGSDLNYTGRPY